MESLHKLKKMMCRELDEISNKGDMSAGDLEAVHKLTDTIKNIDKIMYLEGGIFSVPFRVQIHLPLHPKALR